MEKLESSERAYQAARWLKTRKTACGKTEMPDEEVQAWIVYIGGTDAPGKSGHEHIRDIWRDI